MFYERIQFPVSKITCAKKDGFKYEQGDGYLQTMSETGLIILGEWDYWRFG